MKYLTKKERQSFNRRAFLLLVAQSAICGSLAWRMNTLSIKQGEKFRNLAEENRVSIKLIPPMRGHIYDRSGTPLTINRTRYKIDLIREQTEKPEEILRKLSELIPLSEKRIQSVLQEIATTRAFVPVTIADDLAWEHIAAIAVNASALPGISVELAFTRSYPKGESFAHIVGYVGPVSEYDLSKIEEPDPVLLLPNFLIGKNGIEAKEDEFLRGNPGVQKIEVNSIGRVMRELERQEGQSGEDLQITIPSDAQDYVLERISGLAASAVLIDIPSGDILASASNPSFDPNKFTSGISVEDWRALNEHPLRPMFNKAVSGLYPPASTFKMCVALAALKHGVTNGGRRVNCRGHIENGGRKFHCWSRHGSLNLVQALRHSCDVYFYTIAKEVGMDLISEEAHALGLGKRFDLPLSAVYDGNAPNRAWKLERYGQAWLPGDTLNAGIGQGFMQTSPLQLAVMTARIASGREVIPRLFQDRNAAYASSSPAAGPLSMEPAHLELVRQGMYQVTNHQRGTAFAYRPRNVDFEIAGKTGTAQVRQISAQERNEGLFENDELEYRLRDHGLFVGYAPFKTPRFAVSVVVEHGGGSKAAAPIASDILRFAMDYMPLSLDLPSDQKSG